MPRAPEPARRARSFLGQRGFVLGQNLTFESLGAMGDVAKLPGLDAELKTHHADAIVIIG